ncbi:MAG: SDR family oxidoreductase [Victivallaceae bacterium]|nr:SDR family oxidoreductase [Victivallaceae bacterium]
MSKVFLTGITGLVGSAFVVALLRERKDVDFICLTRPNNAHSALERIQSIIKDECDFDSCPEALPEILKHISVIEGDVVTMNPDELAADPLLADVDTVFHCAADVNLGKDPTGKTFTINYKGTQNVLALAKKLNVKAFHYVSTAYVAGKTQGISMEAPSRATEFNNPYEESKFLSEKIVRSCGIPFSIYRPAIISGRLSDGRVRKPLAFYRLVEFLARLKSHNANKRHLDAANYIGMTLHFNVPASERIYFVPIDYVQKAITKAFQLPVANQTYHVTGDSPVNASEIRSAICRMLHIDQLTVFKDDEAKISDESKLISKFVGDLFPYVYTDIVFDQTNIRKAVGDSMLDWTYGQKGVEAIIRSYLSDFYSNVPWITKILAEEQ